MSSLACAAARGALQMADGSDSQFAFSKPVTENSGNQRVAANDKLPMPAEIRVLMPEWRPLAAKVQAGTATDDEINRVDQLNTTIQGHLKRIAN
jgi:hypothetical protein